MWEISQMICMGILLSLSVIDIHFRRIPADILVMASIAALAYQGIKGSRICGWQQEALA